VNKREKQKFYLYAIPKDEQYILSMENLEEFKNIEKNSSNNFNKLIDGEYAFDDEQTIFAIPYDKPFVVASDKAKEFMEIKSNPEVLRKRKELLKKLNIKIEIEPLKLEGPVLKKTIK